MGKSFFDDYEVPERVESNFLSEAETLILIAEGTVLTITGVTGPVETTFKNQTKQRFIIEFEIEGEPRAKGFTMGPVPTRDHMCVALQNHFAQEGDPVPVRMEKNGQAILLVQASS